MKIILPLFAAFIPTLAYADLPLRKAGQWEVTVDAAGTVQTMKQCTDANTDRMMMDSSTASDTMGLKCAKNETKQSGQTWITDADCTMGPTRIISHSELTGSLDSAYKTVVKASYEPPLMGQKETTSTINGKWIGPCPEGEKPGDLTFANGMKMNIMSMLKKGK